MKPTLIVCVAAIALSVSTTGVQAQDYSMNGQYVMVRDWIVKSAALMPEANYSFKPTPEIRSFVQLLGHIANANGMICTIANATKSPLTGNAEMITSKAEMAKALSDSFAACDKVWTEVTPAWQTETVDLFGAKQTRMAAIVFNTAHLYEHYGNVVTYLRLKGLVPPSSAGGGL